MVYGGVSESDMETVRGGGDSDRTVTVRGGGDDFLVSLGIL